MCRNFHLAAAVVVDGDVIVVVPVVGDGLLRSSAPLLLLPRFSFPPHNKVFQPTQPSYLTS